MTDVAGSELVARRATVPADHPDAVAAALVRAIGEPRPTLVIVFASWKLPADATARALADAFAPAPVIGCTAVGEIGAGGDHDDAVTALALSSPRLRAGVGLAPELSRQALRSSRAAVIDAAAALGLTPDQLDPHRHVAITMVD